MVFLTITFIAENSKFDGSDGLSDLDGDYEIEDITNVSKEEAELKEIIWTEENKDWLLKQERKCGVARGCWQNSLYLNTVLL